MNILVGVIANKLLSLLKQELVESEPEIKELLLKEFELVLRHLEDMVVNNINQGIGACRASVSVDDVLPINNV